MPCFDLTDSPLSTVIKSVDEAFQYNEIHIRSYEKYQRGQRHPRAV